MKITFSSCQHVKCFGRHQAKISRISAKVLQSDDDVLQKNMSLFIEHLKNLPWQQSYLKEKQNKEFHSDAYTCSTKSSPFLTSPKSEFATLQRIGCFNPEVRCDRTNKLQLNVRSRAVITVVRNEQIAPY